MFDIRSLLAAPLLYDLFRKGVGGDNASTRYVQEFIQPFPNSRILDIGCGPGGILSYLPNTIEYVGYDASQRYIEHATRRYGTRGIFHCKRVGELPECGKFDIVLANGVLHHLNDEEAKFVFKSAMHSLKPGGYLVTIDSAYVARQSGLARWIISMDRGRYVRTPKGYLGLAQPCFPRIQSAIRHDMLRIPYTHFIMKCFN